MKGYVVRLVQSKRGTEHGRTAGWQARRYAKLSTGPYRSKLFSDKKHGGTRKAKALAEFWAQHGCMPRVGRDGRR